MLAVEPRKYINRQLNDSIDRTEQVPVDHGLVAIGVKVCKLLGGQVFEYRMVIVSILAVRGSRYALVFRLYLQTSIECCSRFPMVLVWHMLISKENSVP
jgi:hypothetical protein